MRTIEIPPLRGGRETEGVRTATDDWSSRVNPNVPAASPYSSLLQRFIAHFPRARALASLADQGFISLANFATGAIVGRVCGPVELGMYTLAWTLLIISIEISATLTTTPYGVLGCQMSSERRDQYLGTIFVHQAALSTAIAGFVCVLAVPGHWMGLLPESSAAITAGCAASMITMGLREFARRASLAELRSGVALIVDAGACILQIASVLLLSRLGLLTAASAYLVIALSSGVAALFWIFTRNMRFPASPLIYLRDLWKNWLFARWTLASWILWTAMQFVCPWLLAALNGSRVAGIWAACSTIVALGNPIMLGLGNHVGPQVSSVYASLGVAAMKRSVERSALVFAALLLPLVLLIGIFGPSAITAVYGNGYADVGPIAFLLALNLLFSAVTFPYSRGLLCLSLAKTDMLINLIALALLGVLAPLAIASHGAVGAATTLAISSGISTILRIHLFGREQRMRSLPVYEGVHS